MKKGLEEAKALYLQKGRPMLHALFPDEEGRIAVGLAGHGSECFGYDDALSRDHDFFPGFCLWVTKEDDVRIGPRLHHAYREAVGESAPDKFGRAGIPASNAFVPPSAGLLLASEVVKDLIAAASA